MKKWTYIILIAIFVVSIAISRIIPSNQPYTVTEQGYQLTVDPGAHTISDGTYTYPYQIQGNTQSYTITVTFPDGTKYRKEVADGVAADSNWNGSSPYTSGMVLTDALMKEAPSGDRLKLFLIGAVGTAAGVFAATCPELVWHLRRGWLYRDASPSDESLMCIRIVGYGLVLLATLMIGFSMI